MPLKTEQICQSLHSFGLNWCKYSRLTFRVDPRSHSRPLLPEEMDSIRRILSRNLQNFNSKVNSQLWIVWTCTTSIHYSSAIWVDACYCCHSSRHQPTADTLCTRTPPWRKHGSPFTDIRVWERDTHIIQSHTGRRYKSFSLIFSDAYFSWSKDNFILINVL